MVLRMQGFDEGVFGGHFHTANGPPVWGVPSLDVLCHSNGHDWARAARRARARGGGRRLDAARPRPRGLNRRHVLQGRDAQRESLPPGAVLRAYDVIAYADGSLRGGPSPRRRGRRRRRRRRRRLGDEAAADVAVIAYGNGVGALEARAHSGVRCDVIDTPLLSRCSRALPLLRARYRRLLLVDVPAGGGPLAQLAATLQQRGALPAEWRLLTAPPTYNPLGRTLTFVSAEGIADAPAPVGAPPRDEHQQD